MNSADFLDAVRVRHGLPSDNQAAKFLGIPQSRISKYRTGRMEFGDDTALIVAAALDEEPGVILAELAGERAKRTPTKAAWRRLAELARHSAAAVLLGLVVWGGGHQPAGAATSGVNDLYIIRIRRAARRLRKWLKSALSGSKCACRDPWHVADHYQPSRCPTCGDTWHPGKTRPVTRFLSFSAHRPTIGRMRARIKHDLRGALLLLIPLILAGCGSMSPTERAWQTLHLIDVAQTIDGPALDPCFKEGSITRHLIGDKPEPAAVVAWGIGLSVLHAAADRWLQNAELPAPIEWTIRSVDLGYKGFTVANNHARGIRLAGRNHCPWR